MLDDPALLVWGKQGGGLVSSPQHWLVVSFHVFGSSKIFPLSCFVSPGSLRGGGCSLQSSAWKRGAFHGQMGAM